MFNILIPAVSASVFEYVQYPGYSFINFWEDRLVDATDRQVGA